MGDQHLSPPVSQELPSFSSPEVTQENFSILTEQMKSLASDVEEFKKKRDESLKRIEQGARKTNGIPL
jgi:hypothetical protein